MGRPLHKKYFGNRNPGLDGNFGYENTAGDAGLGGSGIANIEVDGAGTGWLTQPTYVVEDPTLPNGITAQVVPHYKALSFSTYANGTGYDLGDIVEDQSGVSTVKARAPVAAVMVLSITLNNGGTANDVGDEFTFSATGFATPIRVRVTGSNTGVATAVSIVNSGVWNSGALPANSIGMTRNQVADGQDHNGQGLQVNFTAWGVYSFGAVTQGGDYTTFPAPATVNPLLTYQSNGTTLKPGATGAKADITMGLLSVAVTNPGDGYINYQVGPGDDAYVGSNGPLINFTPDADASYNVYGYSNRQGITNPDRGILVYGYNPAAEEGDVAPWLPVDVIKQVSSRRYKIRSRKFTSLTSTNYGVLTATNTSGSFSISVAQPAGTFEAGSYMVIHGTVGGAGSIGGYYSGVVYEVVETNGTSTFKLKDYNDSITTVAGAITGAVIVTEEAASHTVVTQSAQLVAQIPEAEDEVMIIAMDSTESLYFVTKLTAHRATLVPAPFFNNDWQFGPEVDGEYKSAAWSLDPDDIDDSTVWIQNFYIFYGIGG